MSFFMSYEDMSSLVCDVKSKVALSDTDVFRLDETPKYHIICPGMVLLL